jgi:hypothetical protein
VHASFTRSHASPNASGGGRPADLALQQVSGLHQAELWLQRQMRGLRTSRVRLVHERYEPLLNAASKAADGGSKAVPFTKASASGAPTRRSMPASSHSTEIGPS